MFGLRLCDGAGPSRRAILFEPLPAKEPPAAESWVRRATAGRWRAFAAAGREGGARADARPGPALGRGRFDPKALIGTARALRRGFKARPGAAL